MNMWKPNRVFLFASGGASSGARAFFWFACARQRLLRHLLCKLLDLPSHNPARNYAQQGERNERHAITCPSSLTVGHGVARIFSFR